MIEPCSHATPVFSAHGHEARLTREHLPQPCFVRPSAITGHGFPAGDRRLARVKGDEAARRWSIPIASSRSIHRFEH